MSLAKPRNQASAEPLDARDEAQIVDRGSKVPESRRRAHARYLVDLDVTVGSDHNFYAGFVENISSGGIFVATHSLKEIGERIELSIRLPESDTVVTATGEIRWIREYSESSDTMPGMGVRFIDLDKAHEAAIEEFLKRRDPLFFDDDF
jgi:uncharacterized protein (TIGR02266 family)